MEQVFKFSLKVWFTAAFAGPAVYSFVYFCKLPHPFQDVHFENLLLVLAAWGGAGLLSLCFSFPSFLLLMLAVHLVTISERVPAILQKIMLSAVGAGLTILPFAIVMGVFEADVTGDGAALSYSLVIVAGIWYYRLPKSHTNTALTQTESHQSDTRQDDAVPAGSEVS